MHCWKRFGLIPKKTFLVRLLEAFFQLFALGFRSNCFRPDLIKHVCFLFLLCNCPCRSMNCLHFLTSMLLILSYLLRKLHSWFYHKQEYLWTLSSHSPIREKCRNLKTFRTTIKYKMKKAKNLNTLLLILPNPNYQ